MRIGYLTNQYPKVSHSFVRRELTAIEAHGHTVTRYSIRPCPDELVDAADTRERSKTQVVLAAGTMALAMSVMMVLLEAPLEFVGAIALALRMGRRSDTGRLRHLMYFAEACVIRRWLRRDKVQHVHCHFGTNAATVALLCNALGGPAYSFTAHGPEEFDRAPQIALREKIERASMVVAISHYTRAQLYRWSDPSHWDKVRVIRCGVGKDFLSYPGGTEPQPHRLVCVGRLAEQKGHMLLLDACSALADEGVPFALSLVGDGPMRAMLEQRIKELGLSARVKITGYCDEARVREEILAARAMVLPSFAEGLPVVIMESLALHRPVISTHIAGIPELVEPGRSGWLVPAGSVGDLVAAMREALLLPIPRLLEMGKHGAMRVAKDHDVRSESARLAGLFRELLEHGKPLPEKIVTTEATVSSNS